jgi:hypothetical protein
MDLVIELDHNGRLWVYTSDGTVLEEAWVPGADETPLELRQTGGLSQNASGNPFTC